MNTNKIMENLEKIFETEIKDISQAYNRDRKEKEKHHKNELCEMYKCTLRNVHKKNVAKRKPKYEGLALEKALAEYYS